MNDTFVPAYGFMRPERWPTYWIMPGQPFGLPSSVLPGNRETSREQAFSGHGATTDLLNGALDASGPAWLHSVIAARTNGGILGSVARANGLLNLSPLGSSQSAVPFGANGGILAPLAMSMTTSPPRSSGDLEIRQPPFDADVGSFALPAEPTHQPTTDPLSGTTSGLFVRPPAPREISVHESNGLHPSVGSEPAPPIPPKDFRTRLLEALSDKNLRYYAGPGFSEFIDKLAGLVPLLPGSGTVQSMQDSAQAGQDLEAGNYASAAAHLGAGVANLGLDWLPAGKQLAILGGIAAKTFPWAKLKIAEAMEKAEKSVDEIWRATGLERGADNRWRFEISDRGYRAKPNIGVLDNEGFRVAPLYEQQVHPGMQAAYPSLAEAKSKIRIDPSMRTEGVGSFTPGGALTPKAIEIDVPSRSHVRVKSVHELQHMIDHLEGHARGGSPLEFMRPGVSREQARDMYYRLAGEVAARNAQHRLYDSELQRMRRSPQWTEKKLEMPVPRHQQIILFYK
jgi:Large polyvalent protein associated domain 23